MWKIWDLWRFWVKQNWFKISQKKTFIISLITFRTFRSPLFYKQESGRALFLRMLCILKWLKIPKKLIKVIFCAFLISFFKYEQFTFLKTDRSPFNGLRHHIITKSLMKLSKFFSLMSLWSINMAPKVYKNHPQKALVPMITQLCSNTDSKHKWSFEFQLPHSKNSHNHAIKSKVGRGFKFRWLLFWSIINRTALLLGLVVLYDKVSYLHTFGNN